MPTSSCCCRIRLRILLAAFFAQVPISSAAADCLTAPDPSRDGSEAGVDHCYFELRVIDQATSLPIGCARLEAGSGAVYTSDASGTVAIFEPGLMGQLMFFDVARGGYDQARPQFTLVEGGSANLFLAQAGTPSACGIVHTDDSVLVDHYVPAASERFRIEVVDDETLRGVPLIEVRTPKQGLPGDRRLHVTDSNGLVAFFDREHTDHSVCFEVSGHGYQLAEPTCPGGVLLDVSEGGSAVIPVTRRYAAERLYRVTGSEIYRDSALLGAPIPVANGLSNGRIGGQDTVQLARYKGAFHWIWGDTDLFRCISGAPYYGCGNLRATRATSSLPGVGTLDPELGVDLEYFVYGSGETYAGMVRPATSMEDFPAWVWLIDAVAVGSGEQERLFSNYLLPASKERGLALFVDASGQFKNLGTYSGVPIPSGPAQKLWHGANEYVYYQSSESTVRVRASELQLTADIPSHAPVFEAFTPLRNVGGTLAVDRDASGAIRYRWRTGVPTFGYCDAFGFHHCPGGNDSGPLPWPVLTALTAPGQRHELLIGHVRDPDPDPTRTFSSTSDSGNTTWNAHRRRFVRILPEFLGGTSMSGEIWYAEADTPMGPWVYARKIVSHDDYDLYQVRHHAELDQQGGRRIHFEGTYTNWFYRLNLNVPPTPSTPDYEYNQIMYGLDLDDERLALPVAVYDARAGGFVGELADRRELQPWMSRPPVRQFFAMDRPRGALEGIAGAAATQPLHWSGSRACAGRSLVLGGAPVTRPMLYALDPNAPVPSGFESLYETLYEHVDLASGRRSYSISAEAEGFDDQPTPLARVWSNPISVALPVFTYLESVIPNAGLDRCEHATDPDGEVTVRLDPMATLRPGPDAPATPPVFSWRRWSYVDGEEVLEPVAGGESPEVALPVGVHTFVLDVETSAGTSSDTLVVEIATPTDADGDAVLDYYDNCLQRQNPDSRDSNRDGFGNACDADYDGDADVDGDDLAIFQAAFATQSGDEAYDPNCDHDGDGVVGIPDYGVLNTLFSLPPGPSGLGCAGAPGMACLPAPDDEDLDGMRNAGDNCLLRVNASQVDMDRDGFGNACDGDYDQSGVVDNTDFDRFLAAFGSHEGDLHFDPLADHNGDGVVGAADFGLFASGFGVAPGPSSRVFLGGAVF